MFNLYFFIFLGSHFCLLLVLKVGGGVLCEFSAINIGPSLIYFHLLVKLAVWMGDISNGVVLLLFYAVSYNYICGSLNYLRVVQLIGVFIGRDALPIGG